MIEKAIMAWLKTQSTITSKVSTRIYFIRAPQYDTATALPYIVFEKVSHIQSLVLGGASSFVESRIQFAIHGQTYAEVKDIAVALKSLLNAYLAGTVATKMGGITWVQAINIDNELDGIDPITDMYYVIVDAMFFYIE